MNVCIDALLKNYGKTTALKGLSLSTCDSHKVVCVLGRNGAGKTTLLKILVGLLEYDSGAVRFDFDGETQDWLDPARAVYVPEHQNLLAYVTGRQYLRVYKAFLSVSGVAVDGDAREQLCDRLKLNEFLDVPISKMSKGTRRKTELVAALSAVTPVVVADEMPEGLDVPAMNALAECIYKLAERGKHFIVSTHDLAFAQLISDIVVVIDEGICKAVIQPHADVRAFSEEVLTAFGEKPSNGVGKLR